MTAERITLEEIEAHGFEPVPEIIWEDVTTLRPGLDLHDGTVYMTIPARVNVEKKVGRGKDATTTIEPVDMLVAVSSDRDSFPYTPERVAERGFVFPEHVTLDKERRWSVASIQQFLAGEATSPNPHTLFSGVRAVYEEYVEYGRDEYYDLLPLYVMGSYMFTLFGSLGYIHFNGTQAAGKSQNLRILDALGFNSTWAANMSAAALFRQLEGRPGITLLDESEGFDGERGEELRRLLNAGYTDGSTVKRVEKGKDDNFVVASFNMYGPKALASINPLDFVLGSRCILVEMTPALRTIPTFTKRDERWQRLRDRLYLWSMYHMPAVAELVKEWEAGIRERRAPKLISRQWETTQLYVVLADYIDSFHDTGLCDRIIAFSNDYFTRQQAAQDATDRSRLVLKALPRVMSLHPGIEGNWYRIKDIHEIVSDYLEEDAKEYFKTRTLGKSLDSLNFRQRRARKDGSQVWLDPDVVRHQFRQRRVEPHDEDLGWLNGEIDYTPTTAPAAAATDDLWASIADTEE